MKKRLILILVSLLLIGSFAACDMQFGGLVGELFGEGVGDYIPSDDFVPETAVEETWIEETWTAVDTFEDIGGGSSNIPTDIYAGQRLVLLGCRADDLGFDDPQGDAVDYMSYDRNKSVQQTYGIAVEPLLVDADALGDLVQNDAMSGQGEYDVVMGMIADPGAELAQRGMLLNLYDMPYLDVKNSYWDAGNHEGLAIGSFLPMATGDVVPTSDLYTSVILFNAAIADEIGVDLYGYVQTGGWTVTKMHAISQIAYCDLNGDALSDPDDDRLGLITTHEYANSFAVSTDVMLIGKNEANVPVLNTQMGDDEVNRVLVAYDFLWELLFDQASVYGSAVRGVNAAGAQNVFERGTVLFYGTNVREMMLLQGDSVPYGILPFPKLDEAQESYQSYVNCSSTAVMVPVSVKDMSLAGYGLEAMASVSYGMFEGAVGMRYCRSEQDAQMLKLVLDSKTLDFGSNYFYASIGNTVQYVTTALDMQNADLASMISKNEKSMNKALKKLLDAYQGWY